MPTAAACRCSARASGRNSPLAEPPLPRGEQVAPRGAEAACLVLRSEAEPAIDLQRGGIAARDVEPAGMLDRDVMRAEYAVDQELAEPASLPRRVDGDRLDPHRVPLRLGQAVARHLSVFRRDPDLGLGQDL